MIRSRGPCLSTPKQPAEGDHCEIKMRLTESESYDEESADSGSLGIEMPDGYRNPKTPSPKNEVGPAKRSSPDKEDTPEIQRLVMLAKHPNAGSRRAQQTQHPMERRKCDVLEIPSSVGKRSRVEFSPLSGDEGDKWETVDISNKIKSGGGHHSCFGAALGSVEPSEVSFQASDDSHDNDAPQHPGVLRWMSRVFPSLEPTIDCSASRDPDNSMSVESETTRKMSNVSPAARTEASDEREINDFTFEEESKCHRILFKRAGLVIGLLVTILLLAVIVTVIAALTALKQDDKPSSNAYIPDHMIPRDPTITFDPPTSQSGGDAIAPPSGTNTSEPAIAPASIHASTPTGFPTASPTNRPTASPVEKPTSNPTRPSKNLQEPTPNPSPAPTLDFLNAKFTSVADTLEGTEFGQRFGYSVASSKDGTVVAIGAPLSTVENMEKAGFVQVYELIGDEWKPRGSQLTGRNPGDQFGSAVVMSKDGNVLVVSEPTFEGEAGHRTGNVRAFLYSDNNEYVPLGQELEGESLTDHFGIALALSGNGRRLAVASPYHDNGVSSRNVNGQVKVFEMVDLNWVSLGSSLEGASHLDWFGWSLDLSEEGDILVVGAPRNLQNGGYVACYKLINVDDSDPSWVAHGQGLIRNLVPRRYDDTFGQAVALSKSKTTNRPRLAVGSPGRDGDEVNAGLVAVFEYDDATDEWDILGSSIMSDDQGEGHQFGFSVALQDNVLAVGVPGFQKLQGQVRLYEYDSVQGNWTMNPNLLRGQQQESEYGFALTMNSNLDLVVGSAATTGNATGIVNVYEL